MHETKSLIPIAGKLIPVFYLTFLINLCILLNLNFNFSSWIFTGLCTDRKKINIIVVLAEDPKPLDAVTKSKYAKQLDFKQSLMEYLFNQTHYQRGENGRYDPCCIVQFTKNYRSHREILRTPNRLFYNETLQAEARGLLKYFFFSAKPNLFLFSFSKVYKKNSYCILKGITDWFIGTDLLPNKHFPIILGMGHANHPTSAGIIRKK